MGFRKIIPRDRRPYEIRVTPGQWREAPATSVRVADLVATDPQAILEALVGETFPSLPGDSLPHVVLYEGTFYLEHGHLKVVQSIGHGHEVISARLIYVKRRKP